MKLTLKQLQVFLAVAQHKNTSLAAQALHLSQSAVSASLNTLEQYYQVQLFDRVGKRLELNSLGQEVRVQAEQLLGQAQALESGLAGYKDLGHLRIGASYTIANHMAINYFSDYLTQFPGAKIDLISANSPDIVTKLLNYEIDIAMIEVRSAHSDLLLEPWVEDELVVFCSANHPLAQTGRLNEADILKERWILREPDSGARQFFNRSFAHLINEMPIYLQFRHNEQIKKAVESGLGIGCLSEKVLGTNLESGNLVPLALPAGINLRRRFYLATLKDRYRSLGAQYWLRLCAAA